MTSEPVRRWWPLLVVAALLVAVGGAAALASPQLTSLPTPTSTLFPQHQAEPTPSDGPQQAAAASPPSAAKSSSSPLPAWATMLLLGLVLVVLIVGLVTVLSIMARGNLRRRRGNLDEVDDHPAPAGRTEDVVAALDAGLIDLSDTDLDPRRAVIACWVRLEQVAASAGTPRQPSDSPTDLVTRLLAEHAVDAAALAGFADVYREARYATHVVDERMRGQARAALERLRAELTAGTPAMTP
jgi:hypothetical protein